MDASESTGNGSYNVTVTDNSAVTNLVYYGEAVVEPIILTVGIITNSISIVVLLGANMTPNLRTCVVSLTASDLCATVVGFCQVMVEVGAYGGNIPYGKWEAPAVASNTLFYIFMMFMCSSALIVILLVAMRCFLVLKPVASRQYLTLRRTRWLCCGTFLLSFIVYLPTVMNVVWQGCFNDAMTNEFCNRTFTNNPNLKFGVNIYLYALTVIFGPILAVIYIVCFILIRVTLKSAGKEMPGLMQRQASGENASRRRSSITNRITKTLLFILVLDTFCTLPTVIQGIGLLVEPEGSLFDEKRSSSQQVLDVLGEVILFCRPAYNFWLYAFTNTEFQQRGKEILFILQYRCRCFVLGLMRIPSNETISRTESTALHHDGSAPTSPTAKKVFRLTPLSAQAQAQLEKQIALEKAKEKELQQQQQQQQNGRDDKCIVTPL